MKLIEISVSGFYGFEQPTTVKYVDNRVICVGANGSGKSNILRLIEFFLVHGTGPNVKLHWEQGDSAWEPHKQCVASLVFRLTSTMQDIFAKWRLTAILSLLLREKNLEQLILDLEEQDIIDPSSQFAQIQIHPEEVIDESGIENSPLFQKLKSNTRVTVPRVKLFWEMVEAALLAVYADKKPYDTAIYYAHTEPRDRTSVVFQQVLCCDTDRPDILKQLNNVSLSDKTRLVFPLVATIEEEINALRQILCGNNKDSHNSGQIQFRGVNLGTFLPETIWNEIEEHLRFGVPPTISTTYPSTVTSSVSNITPSTPSTPAPTPRSLPVAPAPAPVAVVATPTNTTPSNPTVAFNLPSFDMNNSGRQQQLDKSHNNIQRRARRHLSGDLCLSNCGFTSSLIGGENPATFSLEDVKSWCHNLLRKTEQFMRSRSAVCHVCGVKGVNQILRRVLLSSVCILTQDRTISETPNYIMVAQDSVQSMFVKLLESGDRADIKAIAKIQEGMKSLVGQELQSHRYFRTGAFVVGLQPAGFHGLSGGGGGGGGLKSIGGGFKEILMVLTALHGSGASSVILDSPGFSLHPPQQKALALWMAKHATNSLMIITNSTEFVTEDALPSLYCFRRISQPILKRYSLTPSPIKVPKKHESNEKNGVTQLLDTGVRIYEKPSLDSRVIRTFDREAEKDLVLHCRSSYNHFHHIAGSGFIPSTDIQLYENDYISLSHHPEDPLSQDDFEIVTRVRPLLHSSIPDSEMLRILDPALKRLVFATGVFFFEGQSDYRVIEALKHVANNVAWEIIIMHGAGEIQKVANIVESLGIPYGIVVDYDQIMPTINHAKQIDNVDMKLWKVSSVRKFISDRCGKGPPIPLTAPSSPVASMSSSSSAAAAASLSLSSNSTTPQSKQLDRINAEDMLNMITSFRRNHSDNQELAQRLQLITSELKSSLQNAKICQDVPEKQRETDQYSKILEKIEKIIDDSGMHAALRAALVRKELRDIGVFTWNSDLEGMIFGYGDPNHCLELISKMPLSMKQFCSEQVTLSGAAFANYGSGTTLTRPSTRDPTTTRDTKKSSSRAPSRSTSNTVDDVMRVIYLIAASAPDEGLLSSNISKKYYGAFGVKFECQVGGVPIPFTVLVEKLRENPNIQITQIESDGKSTVRISRPVTPVNMEDEESGAADIDDAFEGDYESPFAPLGEIGDGDGDFEGDDDNESETSEMSNKYDEADDIADAFLEKTEMKRNFRDVVANKKPKKGKRKGKEAKSTTTPRESSRKEKDRFPPTPSYASSDEKQSKIYKFQWMGPPLEQEHPDHIFRNPDYWTFVGSVLHGNKDRGGMWKKLPWGVLKDVISSTKNVKIPENMIGKYLSNEDLRKYGRHSGFVPLHIGLQDLVDWMDEMSAKSILMYPSDY